MRPDYKKINKKFWNREYHAPNVESFIFRLKPNLLDLYINPKKKLKVLDYGCGEGSNINHFIKTYKYDGYGVDVSETSIKYCKKNINSKKFKLIDFDVKKDDNFFDQKFDLILSIQVLYFLSDEDLKNRLISLNKMLKPGGYVFFTMQSIKNDYFKLFSNKKKNTDGLYKVDLSSDKNYKNRQKQEIYHHYINYVKNEKNLKSKFKLFKPLNIGFYDLALKNTKDSAHHFTFFGKKNENKPLSKIK